MLQEGAVSWNLLMESSHFQVLVVFEGNIPYLRMYKPHFFWQEFTLKKIGMRLMHEILSFWRVSPAMLVLYVVKIPAETASIWDCYLASYCTHANAPTYYRCIGIFWLHDSSRSISQKSEDHDITDKLP
jgi:hypothetical protein